ARRRRVVRPARPGGGARPPAARGRVTVRTYRSAPASARDRGRDFGSEFAEEIARNVAYYSRLFEATGGLTEDEISAFGADARAATAAWAPELGEEIEGIAAGARLRPELVAALNARTELLGCCRTRAHECTVAVALGPSDEPPTAVQTW